MEISLETLGLALGPVILVAFVLVSTNWRTGLYLILFAGFLQDPIRKFVPGEPVALTAAVAVAMLFVWVMGVSRYSGYPEEMSLRRHHPAIVGALVVFGGLVFFQSLLTLVNFGSIALAGIGLIAYLSPLPAIWIGWWFCQTEDSISQWLLTYIALVLVVALGIYLSWSDLDWQIFNQVGDTLIIYDPVVGIVKTFSGFMRAPEIAAWHLGAAACFIIIIIGSRPSAVAIVLGAIAIAGLVSAIYLTGRRKAVAMIGLFAGTFTILLQLSRSRDTRGAVAALVGLAVGTLSMIFYLSEDAADSETFRPYVGRADSVYGDAWERFYALGLGSVIWAIQSVGFLGLGAGVVSQGGQHFGVDAQLAGAAEGGLGKIIVELGVPGLLVLAWVVVEIIKAMRRLLSEANRYGPATATASRTLTGLVAFLMVNIALFVTASQVFGDPFVLILLGIAVGASLAASRFLLGHQNTESEAPLSANFEDRLSGTRSGDFGR